MKRWLKIFTSCVLIAVACFVAILFFAQHSIIWFPRSYGPGYKLALPKTGVELNYTTSEGKQCVFYMPPQGGSSVTPERVWILFCGNGSLALDWTDLVARDPNKRDGFLLMEYPGYGRCEGSAEPANIEESTGQALVQLAAHLNMGMAELEPRLDVLAHSIGTGAALQFAARHPVQRVVLAAPFTSLRDMARRVVGWPLCWMLRHNFDNRARMAEMVASAHPPRVTIFHGSEDALIPNQMGRTLAEMFPSMATFHEVPGATHDSVISEAETGIFAAMNEVSGK